ncbi:hypothetical protein E2C01_055755 [Portunus trituberculatus]|uniref:Uncharacterized protein n=1 Tax=Portunus trituberculatus TaxID=210409 RepID=A0A5B7GNC8_PORTR|nr:hypothetical protein [Portunus trituberculatus]
MGKRVKRAKDLGCGADEKPIQAGFLTCHSPYVPPLIPYASRPPLPAKTTCLIRTLGDFIDFALTPRGGGNHTSPDLFRGERGSVTTHVAQRGEQQWALLGWELRAAR